MRILPSVHSPDDLKNLRIVELRELACEIRQTIIETVSQNGGHLAPSLGCVELALALHYVYSSPVDRIIWDVGHQAYAHKLVTDRFDRFSTLRTHGGISGFLKPLESEHDIFAAGHSSTSVSAATGIAAARDLLKQDFHSIAVIGDGSLTAGMAFEAMNHAGHLKKKLTVILNDNEMSIAPNVGALSHYLLKIRNEPIYQRIKEDIEALIRCLPPIGKSMVHRMNRVKDHLKHIIVPGALFEELGFHYFGPIDGHDLVQLISALRWVKSVKGPALLHVATIKGKGYEIAEKNPELFHGVGPFDAATGQISKDSELSCTSVFGRSLVEIAEKNPKVVAITAAMPLGTGLAQFRELFPDRYFDVGICEQHAVTFAAGLAREGFRPVVVVYSSFMQRALDQIIHDSALSKLPVIFALDRAGLVGQDGPTHHGQFDLSFLRLIPDLVLAVPRDGTTLRNLLYTAVEYKDSPFALRYPRGSMGDPPAPGQPVVLPVGRGEMLRQGENFVVIASGRMVGTCLTAMDSLEAEGIRGSLIDPIFLKPLDEELLAGEIKRCGRVITVEENTVIGGLGSAVLELMACKGICVPALNLGLPDAFVGQGTTEELLADIGLNVPGVLNRIKDFTASLR
ncbi:MAG: 1-deoxy-D-xylulose-5-phosphate synthase [Candidatus Wallbacteria bacterium]|nr:1-deoxy-D-xylulose-5-phosphate synthase [Candidatus Wallbacteria bacterium]